jgi:hypothetical protein
MLSLGILVVALGCAGPQTAPTGEITGRVTFKKQPVGEGIVTFTSAAGTGDEAKLSKDGSYSIKKLPVGEYKVMVLPLVVQTRVDPKGPEVGVEKPAPNIPMKYRTIGTTDLRASVKEGKNEYNFELRP